MKSLRLLARSEEGAGTVASICRRAELPTWLVAIAIHAGWFALTWNWHRLSWWALLPLGAWIAAWHGSLQHEAIHGHPTPLSGVNAAIAWLPLSLWLPYPLYREAHLAHHRVAALTDPREDPESFYVTAEVWARSGPLSRWVLRACSTLLGRLTVGPALLWGRFAAHELARLRSGDRSHLGPWLTHLLSVGALLTWIEVVCGIPLGEYLLMVVYPGTSLILLRSFFEHRPAAQGAQASAITEANLLARLLYLDNNLHAVHHAAPGVPWFELGGLYRANRLAVLASNGGFLHRGYGALLLRYGLSVKDEPVHPGSASPERVS